MDGTQLYLDGGNITLSIPDTITNMVVKGSAAHTDFEMLNAAQKPYRTAINNLYTEWVKLGKEDNKEGQEKIIQKREALNTEMLEKANKAFYPKKSSLAGCLIRAYRNMPVMILMPIKPNLFLTPWQPR